MSNIEKVKKLLGQRTYKITEKHYGNNSKGSMKIIYVVGHIFDHLEFNNLGYGIISVKEL